MGRKNRKLYDKRKRMTLLYDDYIDGDISGALKRIAECWGRGEKSEGKYRDIGTELLIRAIKEELEKQFINIKEYFDKENT